MSRTKSKLRRTLDSLAFPTILVIWVVCGVVIICQYKGMIPWFENWVEGAIVLITAIPPILLAMYVFGQLLGLVLK